MAKGVVRAGRFGGSARAGRRPSPTLLTPHGWWLRAQVSRDAPPPLPGGYKVGEKVFFTGASEAFSNGNKLVHGQLGEVTGPGRGMKRTEGKGLCLLFPGNKGNVGCLLTSVRRLRAANAATPPPAPHTRAAAHAPCVPATSSLCRGASPHCMSSRSRRSPTPCAVVWSVLVCRHAASEAAPEWGPAVQA